MKLRCDLNTSKYKPFLDTVHSKTMDTQNAIGIENRYSIMNEVHHNTQSYAIRVAFNNFIIQKLLKKK